MTTTTLSLNRAWLTIPLWQWLFLAITTLALSAGSRLLTLPGIEFSALWPASGIFLGAVLALGKRVLWVLIPTMFLWYTMLLDESWVLAVFGAAGLSIGSTLASYLIQRGARSSKARGTHSPLHYLPNLYVKGAFVGSGVSALIGACGYMLSEPSAASFALQDVVLVYWLLEALGVILFAPLFFILLRRPSFTMNSLSTDFKRRRLMLWALLVLIAIGSSVALGQLGDDRYAPVFAFALFPLVCWFAAEGSPPSLDFIIPNFAIIYVVFSLFNWGGLPPVTNIVDLLRVLLQVGILAVMAQLVANINHQRHLLLDRFRRQASQDYRTGLANDRGLYDSIRNILNSNRDGEHWLAYISLTDMHIIKELLALDGAVTVESVLSQQLQQFASSHAVTARLSEGRFAILLPNTPHAKAHHTFNELYQRISQPVDEAGMSSNLRIAMGVTPVNGQLFSPQQYVSVAVQAANEAKNLSLSMHWIDDPKATAGAHYTLLNHFGLLKEAIEKDELELFAQEIRALRAPASGTAFEVLVRMRDEHGIILSPAHFMPAAEAFGLMPALDRWVIRHTLKFLAADPQRLKSISKCAINLSGASLSDPELAVYIGQQIKHYQVPADRLTFEITETEAIRNKVQAASFILAIHQLGCRVALDDFGTGLASFEYLRHFHFDEIKIDGVFIRELDSNAVDQSIVSAICQVAAAMELITVAEFVENESLSARLAALGVDHAQGYGIGKPKPLSELF